MEQERGISLTSTALEFELEGRRLCLLDTPGHKDFSEDTYRSLLAADSVVMVIDAAKGIEEQTRKLFEVCEAAPAADADVHQQDGQHGRDPLELLDEIESVLGIAAAPMNWPIGQGDQFRGVYDLHEREVLLYERHQQGQRRAPDGGHRPSRSAAGRTGWRDRRIASSSSRARSSATRGHDGSIGTRIWPVVRPPCSSAARSTNFGLEPFLRGATELAPPPRTRGSAERASWIRRRRTSAASSSRFRRTWIRAIATAWRSCASVRAGSSRT